jgi:Family of unknown function (DUF5317)
MTLFAVALVTGLIARYFRKIEVPQLRFRWPGLLGGALAAQIFVVPKLTHGRSFALVATIGAASAWLIVNVFFARSLAVRVALCGIALGATMNAIPMIEYGSMPVDRQALHDIGYRDSDNTGAVAAKHVIVAEAPLLGDRFAIRPLRAVASLGDFVEMVAVALLISAIPKRRSRPKLPLHLPRIRA